MKARALAALETRRRIIESAMALHAEQGVVGTTYEEIARRAGAAPATVYRHFPTLAQLLPACAQSVHVLRPVTPELVAALFSGVDSPVQRIELLVRGTCDCYQRDGGWLGPVRREEHLLPALGELARRQRENLAILTREALRGAGATERTERLIAALIDVPVWEALRAAGFSSAEATEQVLQMVRDQLAKEGIA